MLQLRPVVIGVCGSPGAGKTTIATALSRALEVPLVARDELATGILLGAGANAPPDDVRGAAEEALIAGSAALVAVGVSLVLESSVLDSSHLGPLRARGARVLIVHAVASPAVIGERLRARVAEGDGRMQRLLEEHQCGVLRAEIFEPWSSADALVTIDTSAGVSVADHTAAVLVALGDLVGPTAPRC